MNKDGSETELIVNSESPGLLIIRISRIRVSYGVDAAGSEILLNLIFQHKKVEGKTALTLKDNYLLDSSEPPREISNVTWSSGSAIIIISFTLMCATSAEEDLKVFISVDMEQRRTSSLAFSTKRRSFFAVTSKPENMMLGII